MVQDPQTNVVDNNTVVDVAVNISENRQRMANCATLTPIYKLLDSYFLAPLGLLICKF